MFRGKHVFLVSACLLIMLIPAIAYADDYKNDDVQIEFTIPDGWYEEEITVEDSAQFAREGNNEGAERVYFTCVDCWELLPEEKRKGATREEYGNSKFTLSDIEPVIDLVIESAGGVKKTDVSIVSYNDTEYFKSEFSRKASDYGITAEFKCVIMTRMHNGYMYAFVYEIIYGNKGNYSDFEKIMSSIKYLNEEAQTTPMVKPAYADSDIYEDVYEEAQDISYAPITYSYGRPATTAGTILRIIINALAFPLPIIIYRFAIRRKPMEERKAKWVIVVYCLVAAVVLTILMNAFGLGLAVGTIIVWSYITYKILISGKDRTTKKEHNSDNAYMREVHAKEDIIYGNNTITMESSMPEEKDIINGQEDGLEDESSGVHKYKNGIIEEIRQLNGLYEKGVLTEAEFIAAKKRLLER
ncbi:MAG: SHOCT domain-containing protein [Burkholderiales bacterium]